MTAIAEIHFFYDCVSPYSYLAFETLLKYRSIWNVNVVLRPMSLGAVMQATGNMPPGSNKIKAKYLGKGKTQIHVFFLFPDFFWMYFSSQM